MFTGNKVQKFEGRKNKRISVVSGVQLPTGDGRDWCCSRAQKVGCPDRSVKAAGKDMVGKQAKDQPRQETEIWSINRSGSAQAADRVILETSIFRRKSTTEDSLFLYQQSPFNKDNCKQVILELSAQELGTDIFKRRKREVYL